MHDCASVNDAAMRIAKGIYPKLMDIGCFSYKLNLVGEHFMCHLLVSLDYFR